jgi:hypothetical protein
MDAVGRMEKAVRHVETARELIDKADPGSETARRLLGTAIEELVNATILARHAIDYWTGVTGRRTVPLPASQLPSALPEGELGPQLARIRDFLRPAPGRPPDPIFDDVVGRLGVRLARHVVSQEEDASIEMRWATLRMVADRKNGG